MASPFPGMDPFLEDPHLWPQVHPHLIELIAAQLAPQLDYKYEVLVEERRYEVVTEDPVWLSSVLPPQTPVPPDPTPPLVDEAAPPEPITVRLPMPKTVQETCVEVREADSEALVTVVEILSPRHKQEGMSRQKYQQRRHRILESLTHLVEIDLLRGGEPMPMSISDLDSSYRILISRSQDRPDADLYAVDLSQRLPTIPVPLLSEATEPMLDLQQIFSRMYDQGGYGSKVNYQQQLKPALSDQARAWLEERLWRRGLRSAP